VSQVDVLFLCTGNAARSVMAGVSLSSRRPELVVETAGTLVIDGQPMSIRTRSAIEGVGFELPRHASRQAHAADLDGASLVIALAPEHVEWVRRTHPGAATHTATLIRLVHDLREAAPGESIRDQLASLRLADVELEDWEEVVDPGGMEAEAFAACAREIDVLIEQLAPRLAPQTG
jgi:protein-tyrosine-phosphatase